MESSSNGENFNGCHLQSFKTNQMTIGRWLNSKALNGWREKVSFLEANKKNNLYLRKQLFFPRN